jgi:hypothetical protein
VALFADRDLVCAWHRLGAQGRSDIVVRRARMADGAPHAAPIATGGGLLMEGTALPIDAHIRQLSGEPRARNGFIDAPGGDLPERIDRLRVALGAERCGPSPCGGSGAPTGCRPMPAMPEAATAHKPLPAGCQCRRTRPSRTCAGRRSGSWMAPPATAHRTGQETVRAHKLGP